MADDGSGPWSVANLDWFTTQLTRHRERVTRLRRSPGGQPDNDLVIALTELDVAFEELRVADEELRTQQDEIDELIALTREEQRWLGHVASLLPVPVLRTNEVGQVREANAATALLVQLPMVRLAHKPLAAFVAEEDRAALRSALSRAIATLTEQQLTVTVVPRRGPRQVCRVAVMAEPGKEGDRPQLRWVFLPSDGSGRDSEVHDHEMAAATAFAELSRLAVTSGDRQSILNRMASDVHAAIPEAEAVTVTLGSPLQPRQLASDSELAQLADGAQLQAGEGPCQDAFAAGDTVLTSQLSDDSRWPRLAAVSDAAGVASVIAVPIVSTEGCVGVLNVYARRADAFGATAVRVAELVASSVAAVLQAISQREVLLSQSRNLETALQSRAVIDQAKGIVVARYGDTPDEAFRRISGLSQRSNIKVRDIARLIVESAKQGKDVSALLEP